MVTETDLKIFWNGEEAPGFEVCGLWPTPSNVPPTLPVFPRDDWPVDTEAKPNTYHGPGWVIYGWDVRIHRWPEPRDWRALVASMLDRLTSSGAAIAWAEDGMYFSDPPSLFKPSDGIFAAQSSVTGFVCSAELGQDLGWLSDDVQRSLQEFANQTIDPSAPDALIATRPSDIHQR